MRLLLTFTQLISATISVVFLSAIPTVVSRIPISLKPKSWSGTTVGCHSVHYSTITPIVDRSLPVIAFMTIGGSSTKKKLRQVWRSKLVILSTPVIVKCFENRPTQSRRYWGGFYFSKKTQRKKVSVKRIIVSSSVFSFLGHRHNKSNPQMSNGNSFSILNCMISLLVSVDTLQISISFTKPKKRLGSTDFNDNLKNLLKIRTNPPFLCGRRDNCTNARAER